jgi:hypothetical protein
LPDLLSSLPPLYRIARAINVSVRKKSTKFRPKYGKRPRQRPPLRRLGVAAGISGKTLSLLLKELTRRTNKKDARARL